MLNLMAKEENRLAVKRVCSFHIYGDVSELFMYALAGGMDMTEVPNYNFDKCPFCDEILDLNEMACEEIEEHHATWSVTKMAYTCPGCNSHLEPEEIEMAEADVKEWWHVSEKFGELLLTWGEVVAGGTIWGRTSTCPIEEDETIWEICADAGLFRDRNGENAK